MAANFARASASATSLLLTQRLYSVKIDIMALKYGKRILFNTFSQFCSNSKTSLTELHKICGTEDAFTIVRGNSTDVHYIVLYNDQIRSIGRQRFSLAHEIGHIFLNHEQDDDDSEIEANCFAAELIMPRVLVCELFNRCNSDLTAGELAKIFGASRTAAENRIKSLSRISSFTADEQDLLKKLGGLLPNFDGPQVDC